MKEPFASLGRLRANGSLHWSPSVYHAATGRVVVDRKRDGIGQIEEFSRTWREFGELLLQWTAGDGLALTEEEAHKRLLALVVSPNASTWRS
jgi:hypothetical protein